MSDPHESIVCATDFSPASEHALAWAAALARRAGVGVELVHVLPLPSENIDEMATDVRVVETAALGSATERLERAAGAVRTRWGVPVRPRVLTGDPAALIARAAEEAGAQMIVVGMHGRSAIARWLLGSVAERTARTARVPVALVPPNDSGDGALDSVADEGRVVRVLAAIDLGPPGPRVAGFVADFKRRVPCDVTFVHLYWPQEQIARLGLQGTRDLLAADPEVVANLEPRLRASLGTLAADPRVRLSIRPAWGEPASNLILAAEENDADVIVVGPEERRGLARVMHPAVATSVARRARYVPVICLPRQPEREVESAEAPARVPSFLTVLAPTDLSPGGNGAVRYAYALLRDRGGVVELCHVHEHPVPNPPYAYDDLRMRLPPSQRASLEDELRALVPADAGRYGITTHVSVIEGGEAATAIVQAAERLDVDAIAMASHGRGGLARVVRGSVIDEVMRRAHKPVLVVRPAG